MNLEGRLLGNRYEIIRQIGNGGMATVYKAKCHVLNRYVAVKVLKDEYTTDNEFIKRFNIEAQAVASLTHPNIVSVYDVGCEGNLHYIVMELVQGKTLKEIIKEDGALSWKWSVNIAIQIASALETAHKNNIVHRDIKPHNIIITEDGIAKVTDFGIAKAVSNSTITAFGTTIGSVHYFSPEHARGGYTDAKSDIYSLGVVLYEMLTGRVPFDADTPVSVALKHMHEQPVEPIKINPLIPESVNRIVLKAMQKDPTARYSTATEMLRDLNTALKNPGGDFVKLNTMQNDFPTQHMPLIYDKTLEEKIEEKDNKRNINNSNSKNVKKENKILAFFKQHKAVGILAIILSTILLFVIVMNITMAAMKSGITPEVEIPDLVKMSKDEDKSISDIKQYIEKLKLKIEIEEEYNADVAEGKIIKQEPTSGITYDSRKKTVKEGETIKIWVSKGQKIVNVPDLLIGKSKDEVVTKIEANELKVEIVEENSDKMESGKVIKVEPEEKTEVAAGSTVKVYVSIGLEQKEVPNLIGKTEEEAKAAITAAGLKYKATLTKSDSTKPNNTIIEQSIVAGSVVDKGTEITLTLNKFDEIKEGTVIINLKSIMNYQEQRDEDGNVIAPKVVNVKVMADNDTILKESHKISETSIGPANVSSSGMVTIKVYVDDVLKVQKQMNLNATTTLTIE